MCIKMYIHKCTFIFKSNVIKINYNLCWQRINNKMKMKIKLKIKTTTKTKTIEIEKNTLPLPS